MKAVRIFTIFTLLALTSINVFALGENFYGGLTDLLSAFRDPNTGLTSFPTLLVPMGGIAEGMGTAYTAVGRDAGFIEYNPAASALLKKSELAFYHHAWIADANMEGVVYTMRFNDLGIGVAGKFLYVPFTAYNEWGATGARDYISESVGTLNVSYNFLNSYYFSGLAVGANLKVAYRNIPSAFAANQSALAVMGDVGVQTSFNFLKFYASQTKNFSVGAALKNVGVSTLTDEVLPQMVTTGIAWSPLRPWTLAVDCNIPFTLPFQYVPGTTTQLPAEMVNVAVGTMVNVTDFLSVQGGVLLKADNPRVSIGSALDIGIMDIIVNYNLDLSGQLNPLDKFSVQARFDLGDAGRSARAADVDALYLQGVEEYARGDYEKAVALWEKVLEMDPKYQPAADNIRTVKESMELQDQLRNSTGK
jgi:hypothetical protein